MSTATAPLASMAFGVDPTRTEWYSLRQARYQAVAEEFSRLIPEFRDRGERLQFLDVGTWNGVSMRYIEPHDTARTIDFHGVDLKLHPALYKPEAWASLTEGNLLHGLPTVPSEAYDVVLCEQVLEHLPEVDGALATLGRCVKPGGLLILGVPIFPPGLRMLREHFVPRWDRLVGTRKVRGHLQAFSRTTFEAAVRRNCDVEILAARGFRMISGGVLRTLENHRWWWQTNCTLGRWFPGLCTELQLIARKR